MPEVELSCTAFFFEYDVSNEKTAEHKKELYAYTPARPHIIEPGKRGYGQVQQEHLEKGEEPECVEGVKVPPLLLY